MLNIQSLEKFPVPKISIQEQKSFIDLVDKILEARKENSDTSNLEKQIDKMVYKLYELTEDEIAVVEGK